MTPKQLEHGGAGHLHYDHDGIGKDPGTSGRRQSGEVAQGTGGVLGRGHDAGISGK